MSTRDTRDDASRQDLAQLLVSAADLADAGLGDFTELASPSSDEDPPPMTAQTPELTAVLNRAFGDKAAREVRTSFVNSDSSIVVDEGVSERVAGAAAAWMAGMRRVYAECASWTMSIGDDEITVRVVDPADDPGEPLKVEQRFGNEGDEALMRTMLAGSPGQQARITTLLVRQGDRALELTFRSLAGDPDGPEAARLATETSKFLELAPAKFLGLPPR
ncbi:hypothetical protein [Streptomyces lavendulae]|uniref:hypothetical protein n=1 Tax=Streptomyces lavendulae TaxID=1914 RepID=UPI0024A0D088|nr:hypothetical protein [Streptomyces lavendulae]GLX19784.1 hypothetical protein Slala01_34280 [Streptomyces lavendulae subsp. lavendulae]GLX27280.1 hypothetical protein Slala02_31000 [Streptomyces lavendulae subsp. lavendulae]